MPQASDELRNIMQQRFGTIDEAPVTAHLESQGYTLTRDWTWKKEGVNDLKDMTRFDFECLMFLVHEWDFGGLAE